MKHLSTTAQPKSKAYKAIRMDAWLALTAKELMRTLLHSKDYIRNGLSWCGCQEDLSTSRAVIAVEVAGLLSIFSSCESRE